ncbi:MAG: hypothetical protein QXN05_01710 [Acidilobaceae archaeon]
MPRVDVGLYVLDLLPNLEKILRELNAKDFIEWAIKERALLITYPSIVTVKTKTDESISLVLGVGSIIFRGEPPFSRSITFQIASPSWVEGCVVSGVPRVTVIESPNTVEIEGVTKAVDIRDPVALSINGLRGLYVLAEVSKEKPGVVAVINSTPVVIKNERGYEITLLKGSAYVRVFLMASLASACGGAVE